MAKKFSKAKINYKKHERKELAKQVRRDNKEGCKRVVYSSSLEN